MNKESLCRPLVWKGRPIPEYMISDEGVLYRNGNRLSAWLVNGRHYSAVWIDGHRCDYRIDYMVAYTFYGVYDDSIRIIHINEDISDDHLYNLKWYRKVDVMKEYVDLAIVESDGTIIEEWRPCILEYNPNLGYEVNNFGMIRNNNGDLISIKESHGYRVFYYLGEAGQTRIKSIHRAVAEAFIPNPNNYALVNHLDGDGFNDAVYNLEWATSSMNTEHAYLQNLHRNGRYHIQQIRNVCELVSVGKVTQVQISYMTGVDRKTINDVVRGRRWKDVSCQYRFPDRKWSSETKSEIVKLIISGKKGKEIYDSLGKPYDRAAISFYERMHRELKAKGKIV